MITIPQKGFLRLNQVLQLIPVSKSTWWSWVAAKKAPSPVKLGERCTVWYAQDISDFIESQR